MPTKIFVENVSANTVFHVYTALVPLGTKERKISNLESVDAAQHRDLVGC